MKVMLGCMIETSIGITAAAHLSPLADYADLDGNLLIARRPVPRRARPGREAGCRRTDRGSGSREPRGPVALRSATRARFRPRPRPLRARGGAARAEAPGASRVDPKRAEFRRKLE